MIESLRLRGLLVHVVKAKGEKRDREAAKCRALLNVHASLHYNVREALRIDRFVYAEMPVITEDSLEDQTPDTLEHEIARAQCVFSYTDLHSSFSVETFQKCLLSLKPLDEESALRISAQRLTSAKAALDAVNFAHLSPSLT